MYFHPRHAARLVHLLLHHTLQTAHATNRFANILVISRDHKVLEIARSLDATAASESGDGLNQALIQARRQADMAGAAATLILPADLPLVTVNDLYALLALGEAGAEMVLSPSRDDGTNALFLRDRVEINFEFGPHSFRRHKQTGDLSGISPVDLQFIIASIRSGSPRRSRELADPCGVSRNASTSS